jgi:hypothetical protein
MHHPITNLARAVGAGLALAGLTSPVMANNAGEQFGERELALALDDRCHLFSPAQRAALDAARLQARGILLRGGVTHTALDDYSRELEAQADATQCSRPEVDDLRLRVVEAFIAWQRVRDMEFPGGAFGWTATRSFIAGTPGWAVLQDTGELRVGISRDGDNHRFTVAMPRVENAVSAVLVMRDPGRAPELYDPTMGGHFPAPAGAGWADFTPPNFARSMIWASGQGDRADTAALSDGGDGLVFHFSGRAADALAVLDPRETARVELLGRNGEPLAVHYFEIGDFAAARAFLRAGNLAETRS